MCNGNNSAERLTLLTLLASEHMSGISELTLVAHEIGKSTFVKNTIFLVLQRAGAKHKLYESRRERTATIIVQRDAKDERYLKEYYYPILFAKELCFIGFHCWI